jgi:PKD repeat protein
VFRSRSMTSSGFNGGRRPRAAAGVLGVFAALVLAVSPVLAASQTQSTTLTFTGSSNPSATYNLTGTCDGCVPDAFAQFFTGDPGSFAFGATATTAVSHLDWTNTANVDVNYDDSLLRQGQTLGLTDVLTAGVGHIHATGSIGGSYGLYNDPSGGTNFTPYGIQQGISKAATWDFNCTIPLPGESPRSCSSGAQTFDIASFTLFVVPFVDPISINVDFSVAVSLDLSVSSSGIPTLRQVAVTGGGSPQTAPLTWLESSPSSVSDAQHLSCTDPAGGAVTYGFTNNDVSPTDQLSNTSALVAKVVGSPAVGPDFDIFSLGTFASQTNGPADVSFPMDAPDATVTLGTLAANNVPPVVDAGPSPYAGFEGLPIQFDGSASSSICGFPALHWDFSDGGSATGPKPTHVFAEEGTYTGTLTATDSSGLSSSTTFSVNVADAPLTSACAMPSFTLQSFSGPTATFSDAATTGLLSDFSASIDWGDGSSSAGAISGGPGTAPYTVKGSHTYTTTGFFDVKTTINDDGGSSTKATCSNVLVFAFAPGGGAFTIGDKENVKGATVDFWGAQWSKDNPTSGGSGSASFKGFAPQPTTPACSATWNAGPGNSASPPAGPLPTYMGVIVTSTYGKSGSTISGDVEHIIVVKTGPGYGPNPGHGGSGTVIAQVC